MYNESPTFHNYLTPPNEDVIYIRNLRYGRSEYEAERESPNHNPQNARFFERTRRGSWALRLDWRELVNDPYALLPMYTDPTREWVEKPTFRTLIPEYHIYCPDQLQQMLIEDSRVASFLIQTHRKRTDSRLRLQFQSYLQRFFKEKYMPWDRANSSGLQHNCPSREAHEKKACRFWDNYVDRIVGCLLNHFQVEAEMWLDTLLLCDELDTNFKHLVSGDIRPKPKFIKRPLSPPVQEKQT